MVIMTELTLCAHYPSYTVYRLAANRIERVLKSGFFCSLRPTSRSQKYRRTLFFTDWKSDNQLKKVLRIYCTLSLNMTVMVWPLIQW